MKAKNQILATKTLKIFFALTLLCSLFIGCSSSEVEDLIDVADGIPRKTIDTSKLGTNAFVNDSRFGTIRSQFLEVRDTLGLRYVRILFRWDDNVQSSPGSAINFSFYDDIVSGLPANVEAVVVITGIPGWMNNAANWTNNNPRQTFVEEFVRPVVNRYAGRRGISAFQVWNEPNNPSFGENTVVGVVNNPENYVEMLALGYSVIKDITPTSLVVSAATTAINQNYPGTLNYNRGMRDAGLQNFADIYAMHYYGSQYENVVRNGGVRDYIRGLGMRIWVTESGAQGVNKQLDYGERTWPYIIEQIPEIERIYQYQFTEATPADVSYGLRTLDGSFPVSDLYVHLRDRAN